VHRSAQARCPATPDTEVAIRRLSAPFSADAVSFKPQAIQGNRALAVAYIDARCIMDRLDETVGPGGWQDDYEPLPSGEVKCTLRLKIVGEWIAKSDVGSRSDQQDEGDQQKAAFSDALKRAAVKWGIGRYLYRLPKQWVGYDPQRRQFTEAVRLPAWALPAGQFEVPSPQTPQESAEPEAKPPSVPDSGDTSNEPPADGRSLFRWLKAEERGLVDDQLCRPGELVECVAQAGAAAGHGMQIVRWTPGAVRFGVATAAQFRAQRRRESAPTTDNGVPF
jgi:hypothetical protein